MSRSVLIKDCVLYENTARAVDILVRNGKIDRIEPGIKPAGGIEVVSAAGLTAIPGLIDIHSHGAGGIDLLSAKSISDIRVIAKTLARLGTTGFMGTTVFWDPNSHLSLAASAVGKELGGANMLGLYMESPFISLTKRGGIQPQSILEPSEKVLRGLAELSGGKLKMMVVAPEIKGVRELLPVMNELGIVPAFGHTDADYFQAKAGFNAGIRHVTHTFNAMRPLLHRDPGPLLALYENKDVTCELICDGAHVHPGMVKFFYETIGCERTVLMSDGMLTVGMAEGKFVHHGKEAETRDGTSRYADGTLIGSSLGLLQLMKRFISFTGCPLRKAVEAASLVPAKVIGVQDRKGSLVGGKDADIVLVDSHLDPKMTFIDGEKI